MKFLILLPFLFLVACAKEEGSSTSNRLYTEEQIEMIGTCDKGRDTLIYSWGSMHEGEQIRILNFCVPAKYISCSAKYHYPSDSLKYEKIYPEHEIKNVGDCDLIFLDQSGLVGRTRMHVSEVIKRDVSQVKTIETNIKIIMPEDYVLEWYP